MNEGLNVGRERARQISLEAFDRLRQELSRHYPQLAEEGVNDCDTFQRRIAGVLPARVQSGVPIARRKKLGRQT
jgi:hypothetical protein